MPVATQITPQQIIDQIPCAPCLPDGMKLDALIYVIQQLAGTSYTPQQLMDLAKCNKCMPVGMKLDVVIALLDQLAKCAALSGSGDPTGSVTPQFLGQLYHDTVADAYYRSTGLTSADWVAISGGGGQVPIHNITNGISNWWKFDENAGVTAEDSADSSVGSSDGAGITWGPGVINSAVVLDGSSWLQLSQNIPSSAAAFTVSAWINPTFNQGVILYDSDDNTNKGFFLDIAFGTIDFGIVCSNRNADRQSSVVVGLSVWTHVAVTWDGNILDATGILIYSNGVEVPSYISTTDGIGTHAANDTTSRWIGKSGSGAGSFNFSGKIDDLRVWNRVLTPAEILNMYQWRGQP